MKRYFKAFGYLLSVHVLALLVMTLFRLVEFIALHGMIVDAEASRVIRLRSTVSLPSCSAT